MLDATIKMQVHSSHTNITFLSYQPYLMSLCMSMGWTFCFLLHNYCLNINLFCTSKIYYSMSSGSPINLVEESNESEFWTQVFAKEMGSIKLCFFLWLWGVASGYSVKPIQLLPHNTSFKVGSKNSYWVDEFANHQAMT